MIVKRIMVNFTSKELLEQFYEIKDDNLLSFSKTIKLLVTEALKNRRKNE